MPRLHPAVVASLTGAALAMAVLAGCASAPDPVEPAVAAVLEGERIAEDTVLFRGAFPPGHQPDGNSVMLRGPDGWVVFDTGRHEDHTRRLLAFAEASGAPVVAIVNSHWHLDHASGNRLLRNAFPDAPLYASNAITAALPGFLAESRARTEAAIARGEVDGTMRSDLEGDIATITDAGALLPTETVTRGTSGTLGGRKLHLGLADHAVTGGDLWLFDPATRVLLAGDLVTLPVPFLDTACPAGWQRALAALHALRFGLLVPGHGEPMDRQGFATWRTAFNGFLACAASDASADACADGWLDDAAALLHPADAPRSREMLLYYVGLLRDDAHAARYCPA